MLDMLMKSMGVSKEQFEQQVLGIQQVMAYYSRELAMIKADAQANHAETRAALARIEALLAPRPQLPAPDDTAPVM